MAFTTINNGSLFMNTKLYTGNGANNHAITGVGFQPDFVWCKNRTSAQSHALVNSVTGRKALQSNATDAEYVMDAGKDFGTFDSDGFTVLVPNQLNSFNFNGGSLVSWNWKANGTGSANTVGSINSTVSVNTTSGFSIVTYTSTTGTVGHGLGVAPKVILMKSTNYADQWTMGHASLPSWTYGLALNTTGAQDSNSAFWNSTAPTSTVFSQGSWNDGYTKVAYCFAEKQGYSKFGSYVGNGSATDGPFIFTGFKPSFIMFKSTSTTGGWEIHDNKRDPFNVSNKRLFPNLSNAEATEDYVDFVSNGFKFRTGDANGNTNGVSYIYMAFAEAPLVGTNNIPANAR